MSGFNMPPGVSPSDIPGNDDADDEGEHQAMAVMTLRDVFAAKAMQAYLSCDSWREDMDYAATARCAYAMAAAMLKARTK